MPASLVKWSERPILYPINDDYCRWIVARSVEIATAVCKIRRINEGEYKVRLVSRQQVIVSKHWRVKRSRSNFNRIALAVFFLSCPSQVAKVNVTMTTELELSRITDFIICHPPTCNFDCSSVSICNAEQQATSLISLLIVIPHSLTKLRTKLSRCFKSEPPVLSFWWKLGVWLAPRQNFLWVVQPKISYRMPSHQLIWAG